MAIAPKTVKTYELDGVKKDFTVPFEYLARKFVVVTLVGSSRRVLTGTEYRFTSSTQVTTTLPWGPSDGYDSIEIRRFTSATERLVDFVDGSILRAYDLNISQVQSLHIAEEARDLTADTIAINDEGELDARGKRIVNLADGIDPGDAVTMRQAGALMPEISGLIKNSMTLNVPSQYPTIQSAFSYLASRAIVAGAIVTIRVADGVYSPGINANHPQGSQIRLIGNQSTPSLCVISASDSFAADGISVSGGNILGFLDGFTFDRASKAEMPLNTTAVLAIQNSTIICGSSIRVNNWFYGIAARDSSYIYCPNAQVNASGDVGIWAFCGSTIVCNGSKSINANAAGQPWGFGFQAEFGSVLVGTGIEASGCKIGGIASLSNSTCRVAASNSHNNIGSGYFARDTGIIEAGGGISSDNSGYGIEVIDGHGQVTGIVSNTGNSLGTANKFIFTSVASYQARVASSSGPLRLDVSDANSVYFNTQGGLQAEVGHTAGATSRLRLTGSTNKYPSITAESGDADCNFRVASKGTGSVEIASGGGRQLEIYNTNNAVNFPVLTGAVAGGAPIFGVSGLDSNIDVRLNAKGSGRVRLGPYQSSADAAIAGYIEVKDSSGTLRKLAVIA
ncbi:tail fiber protein [Pseudomonas phage YZU-PF-006]